MADRSRMNREVHVRCCGGLEVKFLRSTRLQSPDNKKTGPLADPAFLKYLIYCFDVLGFSLLSSPFLLSFPDLLSGLCELYENWRRSIPKRLPPLSG